MRFLRRSAALLSLAATLICGAAAATTGGPTVATVHCFDPAQQRIYFHLTAHDEGGEPGVLWWVDAKGKRAPVEALPAGCVPTEGPLDVKALGLEMKVEQVTKPMLDPGFTAKRGLYPSILSAVTLSVRQRGRVVFRDTFTECAGTQLGASAWVYRFGDQRAAALVLRYAPNCYEGGYGYDDVRLVTGMKQLARAKAVTSPPWPESTTYLMSAWVPVAPADLDALYPPAIDAAKRKGDHETAALLMRLVLNGQAEPEPELRFELAREEAQANNPNSAAGELAQVIQLSDDPAAARARIRSDPAFAPWIDRWEDNLLLEGPCCTWLTIVEGVDGRRTETVHDLNPPYRDRGRRVYQDGALISDETHPFGAGSGWQAQWDLTLSANVKPEIVPGWTGIPVSASGEKVNGHREGSWFAIAEDGRLAAILRYRDGMLEGIQENYFPNGARHTVMVMRRSQLAGPMVEWYPSGAERCAGEFRDGRSVGTHRCWYENGQLALETRAQTKEHPWQSSRAFREDGRAERFTVNVTACEFGDDGRICESRVSPESWGAEIIHELRLRPIGEVTPASSDSPRRWRYERTD